jgi:hypothetical protein
MSIWNMIHFKSQFFQFSNSQAPPLNYRLQMPRLQLRTKHLNAFLKWPSNRCKYKSYESMFLPLNITMSHLMSSTDRNAVLND